MTMLYPGINEILYYDNAKIWYTNVIRIKHINTIIEHCHIIIRHFYNMI